MVNTFAIQLTNTELGFLSSLFPDQQGLLGNLTPSELEKLATVWRAAESTLIKKDYVRPATAEVEMALDSTVAAMVSVLGFPESAISVSTLREKAVEPDTWQLCAAHSMIVDQHEESAENHILTACRSRDVAVDRLIDFLNLGNQPAAQTVTFRIAAVDMVQVPYIIAGNGREDGAAYLRDKGIPEKAANRIACALDNPVRQSLVQAVTWTDGKPQEIGRLTLLEDVYGLWLMTPAEEDNFILEVMPGTAAEARERVRELAFRVLPHDEEILK